MKASVLALLLIWGGLATPSFWAETNQVSQGEIDLLNDPRFRQTLGEKSAEQATEGWPDCEGGSADVCASWQDSVYTFELVAIRSDGASTPVIESSISSEASKEKVVIHLTGGPMGPVISNSRDFRTDLLDDFYGSGFKVASVGYWGTNFRTLGILNEISYAGDDLARVYQHYKITCECEPAILATSMGAGVALHALQEGKIPQEASIFLLSPVLPGLRSHAQSAWENSTAREREVASQRVYAYQLGGDGKIAFVGSRMLKSFDFIARFSRDIPTDYQSQFFQGACSMVLVGADDFRNRSFVGWDDPKIKVINGADHNLYDEDLASTKSTLKDFIDCHDMENG